MEFWRDTANQNLRLVSGVWLLFTLHSFSAGPVLLTHVILIDFQRLALDIRTALVALLSTRRLIILLGLIATMSAFGVLHFGLQERRVALRTSP
jgi:hypothetical protein